ncbi:Methyl-accepting chemotaxis protein II [Burkholderiaceae bacterium]|nr:Methyl-accepting chemotaxis protein II [Burkholderiaceae bacterium]
MLHSMRIGHRLAGFAAVLVLLAAAVAAVGVFGLRQLTERFESVYRHDTVPLGQFGLALDTLYRGRTRITLGMESQYQKTADEHFAKMEELDAQALTTLEPAFAEVTDDAGKAEIEAFRKSWAAYVLARKDVIKSYKEGDRATAVSNFRLNVMPPFETATGAVAALLQQRVAAVESATSVASDTATRLTMVTMGVVTLGLLAAVALSVVIIRSIVRPLARAVAAARTIAGGNLETAIDAGGRDETGQLLAAMAGMQGSLARLVREVRDGAEAIGGASTEISSGNADLSSRTELQAGSLQQTAASLEQMTGLVREHANASRQAEQLVMRASDVAAHGGSVVGQVVNTMGDIQANSRKISEIVGVIDGIAFQTNILALNAAVEAARAGDQGRGFAVVAAEVRSLAQRSALAAKEINTLIAKSVERVDAGSALVGTAGSTMTEIVAQVGKVRELFAELTKATEEQSTGIVQVNDSVTRIDEMTQRNAALVEQSAAAATSLQGQAARLSQAVSVFRLPEAASR